MDITLLREVTTVVTFVTFIGILRFAMHPSNKERFEDAGRAVLDDEETLTPTLSQGRGGDRGTRFHVGGHP